MKKLWPIVKKFLLAAAMSLLFAAGITAVLHYSSTRLLNRLENVSYDWRYRLKYQEAQDEVNKREDPDYGIHIVDIDERSMEKMGSYWRWDRGFQAKMLDSLSTHFPAAILFDILFYEPEDEKHYARMAKTLDDAISGDTALSRRREKLLERLKASVNYDERLAEAIARSGRVTMGVSLDEEGNYRDFTSQVAHRMDMEWHDSLKPSSALELPDSLLSKIWAKKSIIDGIYPKNARAARQIGHINVVDASLLIRNTPLLYRFGNFKPVYLPMSIRVAVDLFATPNEEIVFKPGKYIDIGKPFKIFKDSSGRASFSYPDFTEAQFRIIAGFGDSVKTLKEGWKRKLSSYLAVFRDDGGGVGFEVQGGKGSPEMLSALSSALFGKDSVDGDNDGNDDNRTDSVNTNVINTDKQRINPIIAMAEDDELDLGGGFAVRRDSDIEWEVSSSGESLWLSELDVATLSRLKPGDLDLDSSSGVSRKLVTFEFWVKREKGVLTSALPVLRSQTLSELLSAGGADAILESIPNGGRRDFGVPARIPLRGDGRHVVTYFGLKSKPFPYFSFYDVMENADKRRMEGRVFIVGSTSPTLFDIKSAPHELLFPGVEIHASILNSIFTGSYVRRLTERQDILVMVAVGLFAALIGFLTKPYIGGILAAASFFAYTLLAFRLFNNSLIWVEMVRPVITIALTFTAVTIYRYMTEERGRKYLRSTFEHYLSPELIDMMYTQKLRPRLGGDTGVRTAYFTDIEGFSTFSEKLGEPTRLVELLNEYLSAMTDILLARYGTLDKYEGDAIIAFFGAPAPMPDHAAQACHTALDMQRKLGELREKWRSEGDKWPDIVHGMRMRIGINTGKITTGNMGSAVRMNYTMMGDAVNLAARLESAAKNYGVYTMISNYTYDMVEGLFETRKLDVITVVGKSEPVTVYELICPKGELGGLTGEMEDMERLLDIYNKGIDCYYSGRDFRKALEFFERAAELEPNRRINPKKLTPSGRFAEMCRGYIDNPPGDDWDGVNRLTSK
jgi:adenylate cyclase